MKQVLIVPHKHGWAIVNPSGRNLAVIDNFELLVHDEEGKVIHKSYHGNAANLIA